MKIDQKTMGISKSTQAIIVAAALFSVLFGIWFFWESRRNPSVSPAQSPPEKAALQQKEEMADPETALPATTADIDTIVNLTENQMAQEEGYAENETDDLIKESDLDGFGQSYDADDL